MATVETPTQSTDDLKAPVAPVAPVKPSYLSTTLAFPPRAYIPILLLLSVAAGSIDVFSVPALGVFVANNTGNLVFLALAAAQMKAIDPTSIWPVAAIVALVGSWFGTFVSARIGQYYGQRKRGYLIADYIVQTALVYLVAGLYYGNAIKIRDGRTEYAGIFLLAISMGSQTVTVKGMGTPMTMPTQVATGAMSDFFSDKNLFAPLSANRARNERFVFVITFVAGGIIGGVAYRYSSPQLALIITATCKLLATIGIAILAPPVEQTPAEKSVV